MKAYETSATIGNEGELRVQGVPFAPGTDVQVTVTPKPVTSTDPANGEAPAIVAARQRMRDLFSRIHGFRGASMLRREDLYDRRGLH